MYKILSINPGSTTTKIGIFEDGILKLEKKVVHSPEQFEEYERIIEQKKY